MTTGLFVGLFFVALIPRVSALTPESESITMSPVNKHYDLKAGQHEADTLLILNQGKTDYDFKLLAKGYDVESDTYKTLTDNLTNPLADVEQWVSFSQTTYHLRAGENVTVSYDIQVPDTVSPGAHTGAIYAEIQPSQTSGIVVRKSVGLVLYANIGGESKQEGKVESIKIPFYQQSLPLHTEARFVNTGNAYYVASETVVTYDIFGNKLAEQSKDFTVLPNKPRRVDVDQSNLSMVGLYRTVVTVNALGAEKTVEGYVLVMPLWLLIWIPLLVILGIIYAFARPGRRSVQFRKLPR